MDFCLCSLAKKECKSEDIKILQASNILVDQEIENVRSNFGTMSSFQKTNALTNVHVITLNMVEDDGMSIQVKTYIKNIIANREKYSVLLEMAMSGKKLLFDIIIRLKNFPLIDSNKENVLKIVKEQALEICQEIGYDKGLVFQIICLEMLYCYALIVNPEYNWIIMDYINQGNKYHQYVVANAKNFIG